MERGLIEAYLWLGLAVVVIVLMAIAFAYLLALKQRVWLRERFQHDYVRRLDAWLGRHVPGPWRFLKARFSPKAWYGLLLTVSVLLFVGLIVAFTFIAASWQDQATFHRIDRAVNHALRDALSDEFIAFLHTVTHAADHEVALVLNIVLGLVLLWQRQKWPLVALLLLEGVGAPMQLGLKHLFSRTRPESPFFPDAAGYSFPSGHTFTATVFYGFLIFLTWRYTKRHRIRIPVTIGLVLLVLLVGLSRVVLSVHWVSDVLGGMTIGLAWLILSLVTTRAIRDYSEPGAPI